MSERILVGKSAREWFREVVGETLAHRRLRIHEATEFYLVDLLASFLGRERLYVQDDDGTVRAQPLATILLEAMQKDRQGRARELRRLGDTALYVSGFFGDSLARSVAGIDYYIEMGERASESPKNPDTNNAVSPRRFRLEARMRRSPSSARSRISAIGSAVTVPSGSSTKSFSRSRKPARRFTR